MITRGRWAALELAGVWAVGLPVLLLQSGPEAKPSPAAVAPSNTLH